MSFDSVEKRVIELYALVGDGFAGATEALLRGDRAIANDLIARDKLIDAVYKDVEEQVTVALDTSTLERSDLRYLVGIMRMIPELERSGDLAEHIARRALLGISSDLTPRCRGIIDQMGEVGTDMWRRGADAYADRDSSSASVIEALDDEMDDLHLAYIAEVTSSISNVVVAMELALVGRFYERFGDHAVNLSRAVGYVVGSGTVR